MINFTDRTLVESQGNFAVTCDLIGAKNWMLRTKATIHSAFVFVNYLLHLHSDGKVVIMSTDHPAANEAPDDDIRELKLWCDMNGWKGLYVSDVLIEDIRNYNYWMTFYRGGLVSNNQFIAEEESEKKRFSKQQNGE